ncbi:MAG: phosphotransferase [Candidatus Dormibacteraeota bacterium]|nr:phosphotransferase [Candidatus Dormibacteraeota bacterium]MBV9526578.1 phosphotransferase [Candidatus Dormibacteraeota bacterium]
MRPAHTAEGALDALPRCVDAAYVSARLAEAGAGGTVLAADVVSIAPGKRAVVRYAVRSADGSDVTYIGKLYADSARAQRAHDVMAAVHSAITRHDGLTSPHPVVLLGDLGLLLQSAVAGATLDRVPPPERVAAARGAGRWLAALHGSRLKPDRAVNPDSEARKTAERAARIAASDTRLAAAAAQLHRAVTHATIDPPASGVPLHRDFHYQHVVVAGDTVAAIDLDEVRGGEAAIDVAHFCAYLHLLVMREAGEQDQSGALETAFLGGYAGDAARALDARERVHFANTCLKLADQIVRGRGPAPAPVGADRTREAAFLLEDGRRCLES